MGFVGEMVQYNSIRLWGNKLIERNGTTEWEQCGMLMIMLTIEKSLDD